MPSIPTNVGFGLVEWQPIQAVGDTSDADRDPNATALPAGSKVTFSATISPPYVQDPDASPDPVTIILMPVVCTFDANSTLVDPQQNEGVYLVSNLDPDLLPNTTWHWRATPSIPGLTLPAFDFDVPLGGTVNLADVQPVTDPISGLEYLRGPAGPAGLGVVNGGTDGQVLTKQSASDGDYDWEDPASGGLTTEQVQDAVGAMVVGSIGIIATYDDPAGTLTLEAAPDSESITDATTIGKAILTAATGAEVQTAAGLVVGTDVQAASSKLTALAAQTWAADTATYHTSTSAVANMTVTAFARTFLDDPNQAAVQATLGVVPGTNVASLSGGVIPSSQMPPLAINEVFPVASQAAMLALTAQRGDVALRTDLDPDGWFVLTTDSPSTLADWVQITAVGAVSSIAGKTGAVSLVPSDVGAQPVDADLTGIAAQTFAGGTIPRATGVGNVWTAQTVSTLYQTLLALTTAGAVRRQLDLQRGPALNGLKAWTYDTAGMTAGTSLGAGILYMTRLTLDVADTITNLHCYITQAGSGLTASQNWAGLYTAAGVLVAQTADMSTLWTGTDSIVMPLTSTYSAVAGDYYVAFLANGTTTPVVGRTHTASNRFLNTNLAAADSRVCLKGSGQTTLPATVTMSGVTQAAPGFWGGLS